MRVAAEAETLTAEFEISLDDAFIRAEQSPGISGVLRIDLQRFVKQDRFMQDRVDLSVIFFQFNRSAVFQTYIPERNGEMADDVKIKSIHGFIQIRKVSPEVIVDFIICPA